MSKLTITYGAFLRSGGAFKQAVLDALGTRKYLSAGEIDALAKVHAEHYRCEARWSDEAGWTFYDGDTRHGAAKQGWARWVRPFHRMAMSKRGGATSKQVASKVDKLVSTYEAMSKAEQRKFLRQIGVL